jgi:hypothetical protein
MKEIREAAEKKELSEKHPEPSKQMDLPFLFTQVFLAVFFGLVLGIFFCLESGYGRPLFPPSLIASKSASVYIPDDPIYIYGFLSVRWSLLFTAAVDIPRRCEKVKTVKGIIFSSISSSIYHKQNINQVKYAEMSIILDNLLHSRIVKNQKICKFLEIFCQNLDSLPMRGYILYRLYVQILGL